MTSNTAYCWYDKLVFLILQEKLKEIKSGALDFSLSRSKSGSERLFWKSAKPVMYVKCVRAKTFDIFELIDKMKSGFMKYIRQLEEH